MNKPSLDDLLRKAFALACFILDDRESAIRTVEDAMATLNVKTAAQDKRLYYKPSVSTWMSDERAERYRNKVFFSELHVLQRLIYVAAEVYEKRKEHSLVSSETAMRDMLIHFIKHLVRITTRRNSFYVTLGINRLLYNYTTAETMETYSAVIQDPARVKDDYYYRSRKGVLMQELKNRFGNLIEVARGPRGEERFQASTEQHGFTDIVRECLTFFTPWNTFCLVPAGVNPIIDGIPDFSSHGKKDEDRIEVDRLHAVLHPDCHGRLMNSLGFEPPERRLEVPHFFLSQNADSNGGNSGQKGPRHQDLTINELGDIKNHLHEEASRRKRAVAGILRVLVDGDEQARVDLARHSSARVSVGEDAELIEVRSLVDGKDLLLAAHLFTYHEPHESRPQEVSSITLEGGQRIAITVSPGTENENAIVGINYSESSLRKATHWLSSWFQPASARRIFGKARVPALLIAIIVVVLFAFGIIQFLSKRNAVSPAPEEVAKNQQVAKPAEAIAPSSTNNREPQLAPVVPTQTPVAANGKNDQTGRITSNLPTPAQASTARSTRVPDTSSSRDESRMAGSDNSVATSRSNPTSSGNSDPAGVDGEATRSISGNSARMSLSEVRKVYVEMTGASQSADATRERMIENLTRTQRFVPVQSRDAADALLRVTINRADVGPNTVSISAVLINARGEAIWRTAGRGDVKRGTIESVVADTVKGLLSDAQQEDPRR